MKRNNVTELVFILDKSGSMAGLESDTIGGFNAMLEKQKGQDGKCYVTTVLFSNDSSLVHDRVELERVQKMTDKEYYVGGCTALIDAIGDTVEHISKIHKYARPEDVPEKTMFVITTDGQENASCKHSAASVKKSIEKKKKKGWEFLFLGANIDAVETAARFGIGKDRAVNYRSDSRGTRLNYEVVGQAISSMREGSAPLPRSWKSRIEDDYNGRKS